ncbi:MAG: hypothetical protein U1E46_01570 [Hyphomicrobiales bacterium]
MRRLIFALSVALLAVCPLAAADAGERVPPNELQGLLPATFEVEVPFIGTVMIAVDKDGSVTGKALGMTDHGRVYAQEERLCIRFENWLNGEPRCKKVKRDEGWYRAGKVRFRPV